MLFLQCFNSDSITHSECRLSDFYAVKIAICPKIWCARYLFETTNDKFLQPLVWEVLAYWATPAPNTEWLFLYLNPFHDETGSFIRPKSIRKQAIVKPTVVSPKRQRGGEEVRNLEWGIRSLIKFFSFPRSCVGMFFDRSAVLWQDDAERQEKTFPRRSNPQKFRASQPQATRFKAAVGSYRFCGLVFFQVLYGLCR